MLQSRRAFVRTAVSIFGALWIPGLPSIGDELPVFTGKEVFDRIMAKADASRWSTLSIGELMGKVMQELQGSPYRANPLDDFGDREVCSVDLTSFDCVTFIETTLAFARMLKQGGRTPSDLLRQIGFIRYRQGSVGNFSTRLNYTTDWFVDNEKKHVLRLLFTLPGSQRFTQKVGFMSTHSDKYRQLVAHPELVEVIRRQEDEINHRSLKFVPLDKIAAVEPLLHTGDIVGVCTNQSGLDIAHTGLVLRTEDGVAHFVDASSMKKNMNVVIEPGPISQVFNWSGHLTGAMFARPLEPTGKVPH
jgi:hypothetical protein